MEDKTFQIKLKCVFCGNDKFELPHENYQPKEGEQITCPNCGKTNDFTSLKELAIKEGREQITNYVTDEIKKMFKKFKK